MRYNLSITMKKYLPALAAVAITVAPLFVQAATGKEFSDVIATVAGYLDQILKLLMGFAVVAFVWYVIRYFIVQSDEANRAVAAQYVMWSLVGFFVILSVWGLVNILLSTFNLGNNNPGSLTNVSNLFPQ